MNFNKEALKKIITAGFLDEEKLLTLLRFLVYQTSVDELKAKFKEEGMEIDVSFTAMPSYELKKSNGNVFLDGIPSVTITQPSDKSESLNQNQIAAFSGGGYSLMTGWPRELIHNNDPVVAKTFVSYGAYLDHLVVSTFERNAVYIKDILKETAVPPTLPTIEVGDEVYIKSFLPCPVSSIGKVVFVSDMKVLVLRCLNQKLEEYGILNLMTKKDFADYSKKLSVIGIRKQQKFDEDMDLFLKEVTGIMKTYGVEL